MHSFFPIYFNSKSDELEQELKLFSLTAPGLGFGTDN